jgi:hypothetical protein
MRFDVVASPHRPIAWSPLVLSPRHRVAASPAALARGGAVGNNDVVAQATGHFGQIF